MIVEQGHDDVRIAGIGERPGNVFADVLAHGDGELMAEGLLAHHLDQIEVLQHPTLHSLLIVKHALDLRLFANGTR